MKKPLHAPRRKPWFHGAKQHFILWPMLAVSLLGAPAVSAGDDTYLKWAEYEYDLVMTFYRMTDLAAMESLFVEEAAIYTVITPGPDTLVQPHGAAIPFDHQNFPPAFTDALIGEWSYGKTPLYTVRVLEHPTTRALTFVNADGIAFHSIPAPKDYNPYWLAEQRYPGILDGKYSKEWTDYILQWLDPSRVQMVFHLVPTESFYDYVIGKAEAEAASAMASFSEDQEGGYYMLMSEDEFSILEFPLVGGQMVVTWDGDSNHYYRIHTTTNLIEGIWEIIDMILGEDDVMTWGETTSTNLPEFAFYRVAQLDMADPGDADGDGMNDVWELQNGLNPLDPSDAASDADNDGLTNFQEYLNASSPNNPDSSENGVPDGWDIYAGQLIIGDVNGDGLLSEADLIAMDEILDSSAFNVPPVTFAQADLNGDGVIDETDRQALVDLLDGKPLLFILQPSTGN